MDPSSVVSSVLGKLGNLAAKKAIKLYGVSDEVALMRVELNLIKGFLKDVDSQPKNKSHAVESWMIELRGTANRLNNVIETFGKEIPKGKLKAVLMKSKKVNKISADIVQISKILTTLCERGTQLGITARAVATEDPASLLLSSTANKPSDVDDPQVVGLDSDKRQIISHLLDPSISRRTVISIVGPGGLGKTTLAEKIYNSSELDGRFQCCAWLLISQNFNENNILRKILYSIRPEMKKKDPPLEDDYLSTEVKSYLSDKRYQIYLDDVWTIELWDGLRKALPDSNNGSRVIITTRNVDVARSADRYTNPYRLRFLTDDESVALLFRTALQLPGIQPEDYPPPLKDVARKLIKKCGGLPLALVVLGGILSREEDTFSAWNRVYETMDWHDEDGEKCMKTLTRSYEALPNDHYRQCFCSLGDFPEDYDISALTRMWVAEKLIPEPRAGTMEDQAEKYLQELVKRCLVQVTKISANGYGKSFRMHDLLRDLAIHKAQEEKLPPNRVALQYGSPINDDDMDSTNVRSLLCFGVNMSNFNHQGFKELRVLLFERVDMTWIDLSSFKNWLEGLVYLRYLSFRDCHGIEKGFLWNISFSGLKCLETLDCSGTYVAPNPSLWEIPTLRHVIGFNLFVFSNEDCPLNWSRLKNLQKVKGAFFLEGIPTVECNIKLRTLKIRNLYRDKDGTSAEEGWQGLRALLSRTEHLISLSVGANEVLFPSVGTRGLPCHEKLQSLHLRGNWTSVPNVEMFPKYLTKLKLVDSKLEEDPMPILERLQSLRILHLDESYNGSEMICSARGFPSLQELKLSMLDNLSEWEIEEGVMPVLSYLEINDCRNLHALPELQNVASLQELIVIGASPQLNGRSITEDRHKIEHIPSICITPDWIGTCYILPQVSIRWSGSTLQHKIDDLNLMQEQSVFRACSLPWDFLGTRFVSYKNSRNSII